MQVDAVAALAPLLARFAMVVDTPLAAPMLATLGEAGGASVPLRALVASLTASGVAPAEASAGVREVLARLSAAGAVEQVGARWRLAVPVDQVLPSAPVGARLTSASLASPAASPAGPAAAPSPPLLAPTASPHSTAEAVRVLQQALAPGPGVVASSPVAWSTGAGAPRLSMLLTGRAPAGGPPAATPLLARLSAALPTLVLHAPSVTPVSSPPAARTTDLASVLLGSAGEVRPPVVADRGGLVPLVAALGRGRSSVPALVVDLRSPSSQAAPGLAAAAEGVPVGIPSSAVAAGLDPLAAALAGALATAAPSVRRRRRGTGRSLDLADLFELLVGGGGEAESLDEGQGTAREGPGGRDAVEAITTFVAPSPSAVTLPAGLRALVVGDEPAEADALAELLGVEVLVLASADDRFDDVVAFLDQGDGEVLLAGSV